MSDISEMQDVQWRKLLTHAHGEEVTADPAFQTDLLAALKSKTAAKRSETTEETVADTADDAKWAKLFASAYVPCHPRAEFQSNLLSDLKASQKKFAPATGEDAIAKLIVSSYAPVQPRRDFETRLLVNLKERQRNTRVEKVRSRRHVIFMSGMSSIAAAAMVLLAIWVMPVKDYFAPSSASQPVVLSSAADLPAIVPQIESDLALASMATEPAAPAAQPAEVAPASHEPIVVPAAYNPATAFASASLPKTVRGIGMELNDGAGWRNMDESQLVPIKTGMAFRTAPGHSRPGLGFDDGTTMHVLPNSVINVADKGVQLREGFMTVEVPESADRGFLLHFSERDIAIEPGTLLVASAESPDRYADGGAPAPTVMVDNGGLALAKSDAGYGPLLANQIYQINDYVTPTLPGRPACSAEYAALEARMAPTGVVLASSSGAEPLPGPMLTSSRQGGLDASIVAPKGFEKRGSGWVASNYGGEPTIRIKYLSDEYFGLVNRRRDLANAFALGGDLLVDGGDGHFYQIYK